MGAEAPNREAADLPSAMMSSGRRAAILASTFPGSVDRTERKLVGKTDLCFVHAGLAPHVPERSARATNERPACFCFLTPRSLANEVDARRRAALWHDGPSHRTVLGPVTGVGSDRRTAVSFEMTELETSVRRARFVFLAREDSHNLSDDIL